MNNYKAIGKFIKDHREKHKLKQKELALLSGVTQGFIAQIESGKYPRGLKFSKWFYQRRLNKDEKKEFLSLWLEMHKRELTRPEAE